LLELAVELDNLNNFNGLFSVISGINNSAVSRLKFTFADVNPSLLEDWKRITALIVPLNNWGAYRSALRQRAPPLIPYLGQHMSDIQFIHEGNIDCNPNGLINFHKRQLFYKIIAEIELSQQTPYSLSKNNEMSKFLRDLSGAERDQQEFNDELYALSLLREPRKTVTKKELK